MSDGFAVDTPCEYEKLRSRSTGVAIIASKSERSWAGDGTRSIARPMRSASALDTRVK